MMMPSLSTSSSSASATVRVDKATSELLVGPDWTMNIEICDICNSNHWLAKDMVKAVKRRLQHKNPKVQLLTLTLLETMVKNCGEYIHFHLAERKILDEMIKIVKKKGDMHVRDKILILLDSWQEAFGGANGKYSQYYWACDELRRYGIQFPQRSQHAAPILTPPVTHPSRAAQVGFGMLADSSRRLDEAMTSEVEGLSVFSLESMRNALELLNDMLQAVNPNDRMAVKDEVIVDLADRCRTHQKKLMQMITATTDEELLAQGLEMNDSLQTVLAKHDAIASGAPLPIQSSLGGQPSESLSSKERDENPAPNNESSASAEPPANGQGEEDEEDEFAQLARRHSKAPSTPPQNAATGAAVDAASSSSSNSNALVLIDAPTSAPAPATANTTKEQDLIDLLSIVLSTSSTSSETPQTPNSASAETPIQESFNSYVVPWAQPQPLAQPQQPLRPLPRFQTPYQSVQPQPQPQPQQGYSQFSSSLPPPPWEATSGYPTNQNLASNPYMSQGIMNGSSTWPSQNSNSFQGTQFGNQPKYSGGPTVVNSFQNPAVNGNPYPTSQATMNTSSMTMQGISTPQHLNSLSGRASNGSAMNGNALMNNGSSSIPLGQKPYVPSYRLFEDLNVFGSTEGKMKSSPYPSASGNPNQNMVAGRR